jgi:serine/threonine protein kinase
MRKEVESLLASNEQVDGFLESPVFEDAAGLLGHEGDNSMVGLPIGPYTILSQLGVGGMGEVYLASDSRLGRKVALKFLPDYLTDADRVERFKQEARVASALNHPNVATIYDIGEVGGAIYIAMEYVEGQTLGARIARQPFDPAEIVDIVTQIASALDEAHTRGITHRDIKSDNIMLTERGQAKVLDFDWPRSGHRALKML